MPRLPSLLLILLTCQTAFAEKQWDRFRGPNGSGVSDSAKLPATWSPQDYKWSIKLPGVGHSSPVIWNQRLFTTVADREAGQRQLLCVDIKSGKVVWQKNYAFDPFKHNKQNSSATHTPAVDAERIYTLWQTNTGSLLRALDHAGNEVWQVDLTSYHGGHGPGTSPIVYKDLVIVCNEMGKVGESYLLALDSSTGKPRWRIDRIGDRACYSTPCIYQPAGHDPHLIFTHSYRGITGVDPANGKQLWAVDVFGTHNQRAIGSPVVAGSLIIGSSGFTSGIKHVVAVQPTLEEEQFSVQEVYRVSKTVPHVPTPLVYGEKMFLWTDTGIVGCFNVANGKVQWQGRVGGTFYSSPVCASGLLYGVDRDGLVTVVDASASTFTILARNQLGDACAATPAISGDSIFFKTHSRLICIDGSQLQSKTRKPPR